MKAGSTDMTQRPRDRVPSGSIMVLADPRRTLLRSFTIVIKVLFFMIRGSLNKSPDFFRMATFMDSIHMKL